MEIAQRNPVDAIEVIDHPGHERRAPRRPTDLVVKMIVDGYAHECRAVEASPTGMLIELTPSLAARDEHLFYVYEICLDGSPINVTARTVWRRDRLQAVRFVGLETRERAILAHALHLALGASDVDRLEAAECRDRLARGHGRAA